MTSCPARVAGLAALVLALSSCGRPLEPTDVPEIVVVVTIDGDGRARNGFDVVVGDSAVLVPGNDSTLLQLDFPGPVTARFATLPHHCIGRTESGTAVLRVGARSRIGLRVRCAGSFAYQAFVGSGEYEIRFYDEFGEDHLLVPAPVRVADYAWSPDGAHIAFSRLVEGNWELHVANADGSGAQRLTNDPAADAKPSWSSDGTRIAYLTSTAGGSAVNVVDVPSGGIVRLTPVAYTDAWRGPAWRPGEEEVGFVRPKPQRPWLSDIRSVGVERRILRSVDQRDLDHYQPVWSPDGSRLAVASHDPERNTVQLQSMSSDGSSPVVFGISTQFNSIPAWSPDGGRVAFAFHDGERYLAAVGDPITGENHPITAHLGSAWHPTWASDGAYVLFTTADGNYVGVVRAIDPDGSNEQELTTPARPAAWPLARPRGPR